MNVPAKAGTDVWMKQQRPRPLDGTAGKPSRESGKLPPPVQARSERATGSAGIPFASTRSRAGHRTHAAACHGRPTRSRVQRLCPPPPLLVGAARALAAAPRQIRNASLVLDSAPEGGGRVCPHAAFVLTLLKNKRETGFVSRFADRMNTRAPAHISTTPARKQGGNERRCHRAYYALFSETHHPYGGTIHGCHNRTTDHTCCPAGQAG